MSVHNVRVKVTPGARKERVLPTGNDTYDIYVREPALRNLANKRVGAIVAEEYKVTPDKVQLIQGHRSRNKTFSVTIDV